MNLGILIRRFTFVASIALVVPCALAQVLYTPAGQVGSSPNDNVGIGTAAPAGLLDVGPTFYTGQGTVVVRPQNSTVEGGEIELLGAGAKPIWVIDNFDTKLRLFTFNGTTDNTSQVQIFNPNGTAGLWVQGNVGIGAQNPGFPLHISRPGGTAGTYIASFEGSDSWHNGIQISNGTSRTFSLFVTGSANTSGSGSFVLWDHAAGVARISLDSSGNVGIGTTTPGATLDVVGAIRSQGSGFQAWGSGQLQMQFLNHGDVVDQKITELIQQNGQFCGRFVNDAYSASDTWLLVKRKNGTYAVDEVTFPSGNVGIGTANPTNKLEVNGTIRTKEVIVETTGWSDCVFAPDYRLAPLSEVEAHIQAKGTLPGIPSAAEVAEHGVSVGDMQAKLLAKLEEMTLRQIAQERRLDAQAARIAQLESENDTLRAK
jgi:hypothetical protein